MNQVFKIEDLRPIRSGMTVSRDSKLGITNKVTYFSMGDDTSISQESYDRMTMYIGATGCGEFIIGENQSIVSMEPGQVLIVPSKTLCGMQTSTGMVYTEIILEKENTMNKNIKANKVFALKDLISYEEPAASQIWML